MPHHLVTSSGACIVVATSPRSTTTLLVCPHRSETHRHKTILPMVSSISVYIFQISQPMRFHPELETRTPASFSEAKCSDTANLVWQCQVHFSVRARIVSIRTTRSTHILIVRNTQYYSTYYYRVHGTDRGGVSVMSVQFSACPEMVGIESVVQHC